MSYLVALLAFAALMIVLATLASVVVEALNMLAGLRRRHFRDFLIATFERVVAPRTGEAGKRGESAANASVAERFVDTLLTNPATPTAESRASTIPLLKLVVNTRLSSLDTRQFIEQLARTDAGKDFAKLADDALAGTLDEVAREFERLGQASSALFASRARALSLVAAAIIAVTVNVDALRVYGALARDRGLAESVVKALDIESIAGSSAATVRAATLPPDDSLAERRVQLDTAVAEVREAATQLAALGLPVGNRYFPYCAEAFSTNAAGATTAGADERCDGAADTVVGRVLSWAGLGWLASVLLSAGLIGLGAPFWFRIYRSVGSLLPRFQASTNAMGTVTNGSRPGDKGDHLPPTSPPVLLARFRAASRSG